MNTIDIVILVLVIAVVLLIIGVYIYKKIKKIPTGDCACCGSKGNKLIKAYNRSIIKVAINVIKINIKFRWISTSGFL